MERLLECIGGDNWRPVTRISYRHLPAPPSRSWGPGAKKYLKKGELMLDALLRSEAWENVYMERLASYQEEWDTEGRLWTFLDMEKSRLVGVEHGKWSNGGTSGNGLRDFLTSDSGKNARRFLNFGATRSRRRRGVVNSLHVWSGATMSRFGELIPWPVLAEAAKLLFEAERDRGIALQEVIDANTFHYVDSYDVFITGVPEKERPADDDADDDAAALRPRRSRGRPKNEPEDGMPRRKRHRYVPGAGRVGHRRANKPGGPGFKISDVTNSLELPLILIVSAIDIVDVRIAVEDLVPALKELLARMPRRLRVLTADAAYQGARLCLAFMRLGYVPNIHGSAHLEPNDATGDAADDAEKKTPKKKARKKALLIDPVYDIAFEAEADPVKLADSDAEVPEEQPRSAVAKNRQRIPLEGTRWFANGHFSLFCECGYGSAHPQVALGRRGRALIALICLCETCGNIVVTAGKWRIKSHPTRFEKITRRCSFKVMRPYLGNPLTFNDARSEAYGDDRHGYQESYHGQLNTAYRVGGKHNPAPIEEHAHLEYVVYMIAAMMWANAIERILEKHGNSDAAADVTDPRAA